MSEILMPPPQDGPSPMAKRFRGFLPVVVDVETGGFNPRTDALLEIAAVLVELGPDGRFVLRSEPPCRYVLVGTGTGITPYRAMLPLLSERLAAGFRAHIVLGVWRREELLFGEDFRAFADAHEGAEFSACYSRELPAAPEPWEQPGYVQALFSRLELDPAADVVYLCGNPGMIDESAEILQAMGFGIKQLRREKYLSARPARQG